MNVHVSIKFKNCILLQVQIMIALYANSKNGCSAWAS